MHPTIRKLKLRTFISRYDGTICTICREKVPLGSEIALIPDSIRLTWHEFGLCGKVHKYAHTTCLPHIIDITYRPFIAEATTKLLHDTDPNWPKDDIGFNAADFYFAQRVHSNSYPEFCLHELAKRLQKYINTQLGGNESELGKGIISAAEAIEKEPHPDAQSERLERTEQKEIAETKELKTITLPGDITFAIHPTSIPKKIFINTLPQNTFSVTLEPPWINKSHEIVKENIKHCGARWNKELKVWTMSEAQLVHALDTAMQKQDIIVTPSAAGALHGVLTRRALATTIDDTGLDTIKEKLKEALPEGKNLYPFQVACVAFLEAARGNALIADEMGCGKTLESIAYLATQPELRPAVVVVPAIVAGNWQKEFKGWTKNEKIQRIKTGKDKIERDNSIIIITYDLLKKHAQTIVGLNPKAIIADECFPGNTNVQTKNGKMTIKSIVESNDEILVKSYDFNLKKIVFKPVVGKIKIKKNGHLIKLTHDYGEIICTPNHKIWTKERGYIEAEKIKSGETLRTVREEISNTQKREGNSKILLSVMRIKAFSFKKRNKRKIKVSTNKKNIYIMRNMQKNFYYKAKQEAKILQYKLLGEMENKSSLYKSHIIKNSTKDDSIKYRKKKSICIKKNEKNEPRSGIQKKSIRRNNKKTQRKPIFLKKRRKANDNSSAKNVIRPTWISARVARIQNSIRKKEKRIRIYRKQRPKITSKFLLCRHSASTIKNSHRSRRRNSQIQKMAMDRQKKKNCIGESRVASVEVLEQRYIDEHGICCDNNKFVYNLEVKDTHNYIADNVLVSNCQFLKNSKSQRTEVFMAVAKTKSIRSTIGLSGTPIVNRPIEFYPMLKLLRPADFSNWKFFTKRYCSGHYETIYIARGHGATKSVWVCSGSSNEKELSSRIKDVMIRRLKKDVLSELPPKHRNSIEIEISSAERDEYNNIVESCYTGEPGDHLAAINCARQLVGKYKAQKALDLIDMYMDQNQPLLVFAHHHEVMNKLEEEIKGKYSYGKIDGTISQDKRTQLVEDFQSGKINLLILSIKAAGVGITLTRSSNVIFLERAWTPADEEQAEDRTHRPGQKNNVLVQYLCIPDTVDDMMGTLIDAKRDILEKILNGGMQIQEDLNIKKELLQQWTEKYKHLHEKAKRRRNKDTIKTQSGNTNNENN